MNAIRLTRVLVRQHRATIIGLPVLAGVLTAAVVPSYATTYATPEDVARAVALARANTTSLFLYGPLAADGDAVELAVWEMGAILCLVSAVMVALIAVTLGRGAEDAGQVELVRAQGVPAGEVVAAQAAVVALVSALTGAASGAGLLALEPAAAADAAALGASLAASCLLVGAVALVGCQAAADVAQAWAVALSAVGAAFLGQGLDAAEGWSWAGRLSPLGVRALVAPGGANDLAPAGWAALAAGLLVAGAAFLGARRDLGAGLVRLPQRSPRGLPHAGLPALVWRLEWRGMLAWAVVVAGIGSLLVAMGSTVVDLAREGSVTGGALGAMFGGESDPGTAFLSYVGSVVGILVAVEAVSVVGRVGSAESRGLVETLRATGTGPARVLAGWAVAALTAAAFSLLVALVPMSVIARTSLEVGVADSARLLLGQWPATAAAAGLCALLVGAAPAWRALAWAPVVAGALVTQLGGVLDLPQWLMDSAPFALAGQWRSLWLVAVAAAGLAAGLDAIRRRDLGGRQWSSRGRVAWRGPWRRVA